MEPKLIKIMGKINKFINDNNVSSEYESPYYVFIYKNKTSKVTHRKLSTDYPDEMLKVIEELEWKEE